MAMRAAWSSFKRFCSSLRRSVLKLASAGFVLAFGSSANSHALARKIMLAVSDVRIRICLFIFRLLPGVHRCSMKRGEPDSNPVCPFRKRGSFRQRGNLATTGGRKYNGRIVYILYFHQIGGNAHEDSAFAGFARRMLAHDGNRLGTGGR